MIIENAFFKLPELLLSSYDHGDTFEATVVHFFALATIMELNCRNIPQPYEHVATEKPYPTTSGKVGALRRSDLYVNLSGVFSGARGRIEAYGVREKNWIEAKAYLRSTRSGGMYPKTSKAGDIVRDIFRLCLLPEEHVGGIRQNARYLFIVASEEPEKSVAFHNQGRQERAWLSALFSEGHSQNLSIDLGREPDSLRKAVGPGLLSIPDLRIDLGVHTMVFEPKMLEPRPVYWGFLSRIEYFRICVSELGVEFYDRPNESWSQYQNEQMNAIRGVLLPEL